MNSAQLGRELATEIGNASKRNDINQITRYIAHAATGCLTESLTAGINQDDVESGCASGAGGAVVGEAIGDLVVYSHQNEVDLLENLLKDELEYLDTFGADDADGKMILALLKGDSAYYEARLDQLYSQGVDLARVGASLSAFLAGADVANIHIAADAGESAAANNALPLLFWGATALLSAVGAYLTAVELKTLGEQIIAAEQAGDIPKRNALLKDLAGKLALEAGLALVGLKAADALLGLVKKAREKGFDDKIIGKLGELVTRGGVITNRAEFDSRFSPDSFPSQAHVDDAWKAYRSTSTDPRPIVMGRKVDTKAGEALGFQRLNARNWSEEVNDAWVQGGVDAGRPFYLGSSADISNYRAAWNALEGNRGSHPPTVFFREMKQLRDAGYRLEGDYMVPPG